MLKLADAFAPYFNHLKFDKRLIQALEKFQIDFVNKNDEHMSFFTSKLMGVHVVTFAPRDLNTLYTDVLEIDIDDIRQVIPKVTMINTSHIVTSEPFNLIMIYCAHRFLSNGSLSKKDQYRGAFLSTLILNYRFITGMMKTFYPYPIDAQTAQAVYANLSMKYLIKRLDNWEDVLEYRANSMVVEDGLHHKTLTQFDDDVETLKVIADAYGRIKDMMKNIMGVFKYVHSKGEKIYSRSETVVDLDGQEIVRDKTHGLSVYENYIQHVVADPNSFIKNELIQIVLNLMANVNEKNFLTALTWFSQNSDQHEVSDFVHLVIVHSYDYIESHRSILNNTKDLGLFLSTLRGAYMSSRSMDKNLLDLRKSGERMMKKALKTSNQALLANIRTSLMLYINLRAYTKNYYSS